MTGPSHSEGDHLMPRYPQGDVAGMECVYCPECGDPDPDGLPSVEAFEEFGVVCCPECAAALFENEETT